MNDGAARTDSHEPLEEALQMLRNANVSPLPDAVVERTRSAMGTSRPRSKLPWRALAAALVGALGLAAFLLQGHGTIAFADVAAQVEATRTLRATLVDPREGGTLLVSGRRMRLEGQGAVMIADAALGEELMLNGNSQEAYRIPQRGMSRALDFYALFKELAKVQGTPIPGYVDKSGRSLPGVQGRANLDLGGGAAWSVDAKAWIEPASKLPVRLEIQPVGGHGEVVVLEDIEFDVPLAETLFSMTVPPGYKVVGTSPSQLKPAPTADEAAQLTIKPGVGVGDVKFGMSRGQIVAILGEPESTLHNTYLNYSSKGLQLILVGREPDKLGKIIANPYDAASLVRNEFLGQTDKGICIGSTEQQVIDAYGPPDPRHPQSPPHQQYAAYKQLGVQFAFMDGKVAQIIASRTD